jgi:hypothetical protein
MRGWCRSALIGAVALVVFGCELSPRLPPPLHGRWTCSDPRYQGRSLFLTANSVTFGTGATDAETYVVRGVASTRDRTDGVHYRVAYGLPNEADRELRLHLVYGAPLALRIGDRPERWQKAGPR